MRLGSKPYWTKDRLREEALKYNYVSDFSKNNRVALEKIQREGWFDEMCSHLKYKTKPNGYWNEKTVRFHAKECKNRCEFNNRYNQGYRFAKKLGILDELFGKISQKPINYWNEDTILNAAIQCKNINELHKNFGGAYHAAKKLGIIDYLFNKKHNCERLIWTKENILKVHNPNETKMEFIRKYASAASAARGMGIWDNLKFKKVGSGYKRCIYAIEFENRYVYVGLTYNFEKRMWEHFNHKKKYSTVRNYHLKNPNLKYDCIKLSEYMDVNVAVKEEGNVLDIYKKDGWKILNKSKTGGVGGMNCNFNKKEIIDISKKYSSTKEFKKDHSREYMYAIRGKFVNELHYNK